MTYINFINNMQEECALLNQWDQGVILRLSGLQTAYHQQVEVRFFNELSAEAIRVVGYTVNDMGEDLIETRIPNIMLQSPLHIKGLVCVVEQDSETVIAEFHIAVQPGPMPQQLSTDPEDVHYLDDLGTLLESANEALRRSDLIDDARKQVLGIAEGWHVTRVLRVYVSQTA